MKITKEIEINDSDTEKCSLRCLRMDRTKIPSEKYTWCTIFGVLSANGRGAEFNRDAECMRIFGPGDGNENNEK